MRGRLSIAIFLFALPLLPFALKLATQPSAVESRKQVQHVDRAAKLRSSLLMSLDLFVRAERALRRETGSYSKAIGRVPDVLGALAQYYRIDIARASQSKLLVVAVGEGNSRRLAEATVLAGDRVAIDDQFRVIANFPVPEPPRDYLHALAQVVMNRVFRNQFVIPKRGQLDLWEGLFRRYFRYEIKPVSQGGRTLMAVGLKGPVKGDVVEMRPGANLFEWVYNYQHSSGFEYEVHGDLEQIYLAQRIYQDHMGSFSPTFRGLIPGSNALAALTSEVSPVLVQEFQEDPAFGFHAELVRNASAVQGTTRREPSSHKGWSINGYGQVAEVSSMESLVERFEQTWRQIDETTGGGLGDSLGPQTKMKPLLIDALEADK